MDNPHMKDHAEVASDLLNLLYEGDGPFSLTITRLGGQWSVTLLDTIPAATGTFFGQGTCLEDALMDCCDVRLRAPMPPAEDIAPAEIGAGDPVRLTSRRNFRIIDGDKDGEG